MTQNAYARAEAPDTKGREAVNTGAKTAAAAKALPEYSVIMSVYAGETGANLSLSLESMLTQTLPPAEIILVKDGPLTPELEQVIEQKKAAYPGIIETPALQRNSGLGAALNEAIKNASCEYLARMDSDDISLPDRMEKQMRYLGEHGDIDILSGAIEEFDKTTDQITGARAVPLDHESIRRFALTRSPFNHVAAVFKKSAVERAGLYRTDLIRVEDHDLWMRMLRTGAVCANLPDSLVYVRCGDAMHKKRHGLKNARALKAFYREMYLLGEITLPHYILDVTCACGLQFMPVWLHRLSYKLLRREKIYKAKAAPRAAALPRGENLLYTPSDEERRKAQTEILGIYRDVKRVCEKYGLRLILAGGSCLGSLRGGGFIPWDDDMDTVMPREDYERFKALFDMELGEKYALQVPNSKSHIASNLFMKVVKRGSAVYTQPESAAFPGEKGLWLDIVPIDGVPREKARRIIKGIACDVLSFASVSACMYKYRNPVYRAYMSASLSSRVRYALRNALGFVMSVKDPAFWYDLTDSFVRESGNTEKVTCAFGIKHYFGEMRDRNVFLPPAEGEFEGESGCLPARAHVYLRSLYGADYLTPPPESKRRGHSFVKPEYEDFGK